MADLYTGHVFKNRDGWAKYRCLMRDSHGYYIMQSLVNPEKLVAVREIDLITRWRVIA